MWTRSSAGAMAGVRCRRIGSPQRRSWPSTVLLLIVLVLAVLFLSVHLCSWALWRANSLGRICIPGDNVYCSKAWADASIAIVSFSDVDHAAPDTDGHGGGETRKMGPRARTFEGLDELVETNKKDYARMWGYDYINARSTIDKSRPASWSKIPAVRSHLHRYDWIFWNDADSLVTNPSITLQRILQSVVRNSDCNSYPADLIVTEDVNGINAGMFLVRRTRWSEEFLDAWWNMTTFVTRGFIPVHPCTVAYSEGDFMAHLAGLEDKKGWAIEALRQLKASSSPWSSFVYGLGRYHQT